MVQFGSPATVARVFFVCTPNRKVPHGQTLRDLRQRAAIRTPRQSRQEPGQPEVPAQPPDGPGDRGRQERAGADLHALPAYLRRLASSRSRARAPLLGARDPSAEPPTPAPAPRRLERPLTGR